MQESAAKTVVVHCCQRSSLRAVHDNANVGFVFVLIRVSTDVAVATARNALEVQTCLARAAVSPW